MLNGIPAILTPDLVKALMEMGHGDEIVLGDGNFPAAYNARLLIRADGHGIPELLDAILKLFPLDDEVECALALMAVSRPGAQKPEIWDRYSEIVACYAPEQCNFEQIERFSFYDRASRAYAIVATSESCPCANLILKKGAVKQS